ncbi:MAG: riboflavin synthase [Candidatus Aminicenantes bacterium]|nr:riboflavin synthase [Candidatus Aminicenantes bacterium]NIM81363.1 riboflavin synthase [Candidatus Aminicenantes bacterium]NIN20774.1 riboflavin synthase [Candidatus Aminicenantes bacterium]NIN44552.1 riboflavin synthase [Candidatus Aminicenantes bacterium]NIN87372.1 riboflavin synthase [Candidatus Aminicenantes bacterium]
MLMFTGIILKMGKLVSLEKKNPITLTIETGSLEDVKPGDSVAVNGACLTVVATQGSRCQFNLSNETLTLSNFGDLPRGAYVNLELPLTMKDFLGGHLVSGHLDGVVRVKSIRKRGDSVTFSFTFQDREWRKFLVHKGSAALNGISLTLTDVGDSFFSVEVIPHTLDTTNLQYVKVGERLNLELDLIGKYLYNLVSNTGDWAKKKQISANLYNLK